MRNPKITKIKTPQHTATTKAHTHKQGMNDQQAKQLGNTKYLFDQQGDAPDTRYTP
jgi:hypothetical protein